LVKTTSAEGSLLADCVEKLLFADEFFNTIGAKRTSRSILETLVSGAGPDRLTGRRSLVAQPHQTKRSHFERQSTPFDWRMLYVGGKMALSSDPGNTI
jgi:hypothetical protein